MARAPRVVVGAARAEVDEHQAVVRPHDDVRRMRVGVEEEIADHSPLRHPVQALGDRLRVDVELPQIGEPGRIPAVDDLDQLPEPQPGGELLDDHLFVRQLEVDARGGEEVARRFLPGAPAEQVLVAGLLAEIELLEQRLAQIVAQVGGEAGPHDASATRTGSAASPGRAGRRRSARRSPAAAP